MKEKEDFSIEGLDKNSLQNLFLEFLEHIKNKNLVSQEILIPITIFDSNKISSFQLVVKYLKENYNLTYHQLALLVNRDDRTIWSTYNNAIKKKKGKFVLKETRFYFPISIIYNRKLSVLESIVKYLKENYNLTYHQLALLVNRDDRTIWSTYNNALKKWK